MSLIDDLCDICGKQIDMMGDPGCKTGVEYRLWCGACHQDMRPEINQWLRHKRIDVADLELDIETTSSTRQNNISSTNLNNSPTIRPTWDEYYLGVAAAVAARGDCARRQIGAVIVKGHKIVSSGYNGTPPGDDRSCRETGQCPRNLDSEAQHSAGEYDLCWASHAEANALLRANWDDMQDATIYVTGEPCPGCAKLIRSSGIGRVVHP